MKESSADPPDIDNRSGPLSKAYGVFRRATPTQQPRDSLPWTDSTAVAAQNNTETDSNNNSTSNSTTNTDNRNLLNGTSNGADFTEDASLDPINEKKQHGNGSPINIPGQLVHTASSQDERQGSVLDTKEGRGASISTNENTNNTLANGDSNTDAGGNDTANKKRRTFMEEFRRNARLVITYSWLNVLLVFVPLGIIVSQIHGIPGGVVFAINCVAVIPLAGLLSHATESVARKMGDALGALLNVTFGNAVELIILIALVKNEIRIVQASLLGSILANLLLILGMGFFFGGLRYREQIYNSTVTQMSACLLSLSVISLVLPTAFHASFSDNRLADAQSLKISRGTSVILLLVYGIYLLFQLKSHAYMYESTPQHIVDAESTPGPAAGWLDSSSSDDSSSSSSDSDDSRDTVRKRMKKVLRAGRRRKSSVASIETSDTKAARSSSFISISGTNEEVISESSSARPGLAPRVASTETNEEATDDEKKYRHGRRYRARQHMRRKKDKKRARREFVQNEIQMANREHQETHPETGGEGEPRRVDFAIPAQTDAAAGDSANEAGTAVSPKRPFNLRGMSIKNLAPTVFIQPPEPGPPPPATGGPVPRVRYGIRRTNSLPDRLNQQQQQQQHMIRPPGALFPARVPSAALSSPNGVLDGTDDDDNYLSRTASIVLLLLTTGLVAACAEFLVGSIQEVTSTSSIGEIFIGLIILPIVGNAAEHVTAVTVAMKNKMDLAIGVAVGSSIQIAIFVTPLVVILGWIIDRDMTLYFTLFETVCLFVSAFMVNFLVLDGRSNYLEGALLCAVYVIIAVVAFFYPDAQDASSWGS